MDHDAIRTRKLRGSEEIRARLKRADAGIAETIPWSGPVVASTRQPAVTCELEYLREALVEAGTAAHWYTERSSAAAAFSEEVDQPSPQLLDFQMRASLG